MLPVCPKCDISLLILRFHGIEIDCCERCRGLWLDEGELAELLVRTGGSSASAQFVAELGLDPQAGRTTRYLCPRCDQALQEFQRDKLLLDLCPRAHGIWFDAGELRSLLGQLPESSGARQTIDFLNEMFSTPNPRRR